ncbi:LuxR C-terminal-related transcriptional regulator [Streptomyces sp. NBC_00234]|uniref:helix-turn-helix domain-containing protein n=1 Tax=Streptomyces sp. NBC_00234 TaxID=2903638 RepID=UPI002E2A1FD2|nr:helix-turn-helix domain-containing protein [Streptomyces sp. NBC_00234]
MLETLGLSTAESQLYQLLVRSGRIRTDQVRQRLHLSDAQTDEAAQGLVAKGLVTLTDEQPAQLIPSPPDIAGEELLLLRMNQLRTARGVLNRLTKEYRQAATSGPVALEEFAEIVPDETLALRYEQIQRNARKQVLRFDAPPYVLSDGLNAAELDQLTAGVTYRTVYDRLAVTEAGALQEIQQYVDAGERARVLNQVPVKLVVVDRSTALLSMRAEASEVPGVTVLIHPGPLLDALLTLFEMVWASALPLDPVSDQGPLTPSDAQLLTLLLSGLTDDAIARQLGLGKRTVNRRVHSLMTRAGVSSRMQLGWQTARLGWITDAPVPATGPQAI